MPLIVCLDTNIFVRQTYLLRWSLGPAIKYFLEQNEGRLFLPEILRLEYEEQTVIAAREFMAEANVSVEGLRTLTNGGCDLRLPAEEAVRAAFKARLAELESLIIPQTLTDELKVATSDRLIAKRAPVGLGYKDCLIWESILRLDRDSDVRLVSQDKAFFSEQKEKKLAPTLEAEAQAKGIRATAYIALQDLLKALKAAIAQDFDRNTAKQVLHRELSPVHFKLIAQWGLFSLGPPKTWELTAYRTENPQQVNVTFREILAAGNATIAGTYYQGPNRVEISGSFNWNPETKELTGLQVEREVLLGRDGSILGQNATIFVRGGKLTIGPSQVP